MQGNSERHRENSRMKLAAALLRRLRVLSRHHILLRPLLPNVIVHHNRVEQLLHALRDVGSRPRRNLQGRTHGNAYSHPLLDSALLANALDVLVGHPVVLDITLVHQKKDGQRLSIRELDLLVHLALPLHNASQRVLARAVAHNARG